MVRQGSTEYVTGGTDPDQLFDLALDPEERVNLADSASHQSVMADSAALAAIQWNPETLDQDIRSSQRRRLFLRNLGSGDLSYPPPPNLAHSRVFREGPQFNEWLYGSEIRPAPGVGGR